MQSIKWIWKSLTFKMRTGNLISLQSISIDMSTFPKPLQWLRIKSFSSKIQNILFPLIKLPNNRILINLTNFCNFIFYQSNYDKDGEVKGLSTVTYKKQNASPFFV
jgi:hypothetical protein